ncbi:MAG: ribosome silencing factor [Gemmatimonadales bacterium]|nr:MAG: ribosome silencing factor [Gemmatimonadales bacterium]
MLPGILPGGITLQYSGVSVKIETEQKLEIVQRLLVAKKADEIEVIDLRGRTLIADYFVVCSGTSNTHIKAIADGLIAEGKDEGLKKDRVEGYAQACWVLVDYGDVVVHIFAREEREYYDIESLWKATVAKLEIRE